MKFLAAIGRGYVWAAAALFTVSAVVLGLMGTDRLQAAAEALRGAKPAAVAPAAPATPEEAWKELESARRAARDVQETRARELEKREERVATRLALLEGEREGLERARREHDAAAGRARLALDELAAAKSDAEMRSTLPIFSQLDGAALLSLIKGWEDSRIVRTLRGLRPAKAAEVLEAMGTDPQFEQDFRQVPAGAPRGTRTRAEVLMDEFKK